MINCAICGKEVYESDQETLDGKNLCFLCGVNKKRLLLDEDDRVEKAKEYFGKFQNNLFDKKIEDAFQDMMKETKQSKDKPTLILCPCCNQKVSNMAASCIHCGHPLKKEMNEKKQENMTHVAISQSTIAKKTKQNVEEKHKFSGIYRVSLFGKKKTEIYCPKCGSENCEWIVENVVVPDKVKTKYTANLNPLKPFTLVNKKEKVVSKGYSYDRKKIKCNSCGKTFY